LVEHGGRRLPLRTVDRNGIAAACYRVPSTSGSKENDKEILLRDCPDQEGREEEGGGDDRPVQLAIRKAAIFLTPGEAVALWVARMSADFTPPAYGFRKPLFRHPL
jgi:hypothetical protein